VARLGGVGGSGGGAGIAMAVGVSAWGAAGGGCVGRRGHVARLLAIPVWSVGFLAVDRQKVVGCGVVGGWVRWGGWGGGLFWL